MVDGLYTSLRFDPALQDVEENTQVVGHVSMYSMVPYHRDRLVVAAKAFGWSEAAVTLEGTDGYERFFAFLESHKREWDLTHDPRQPVKVRPVLHEDGSMDVSFTPEPPRDAHAFFTNAQHSPDQLASSHSATAPVRVHVDSQPTSPSELTRYKTTSRDHYLDARERVGLGRDYAARDEALLWNEAGELTECSISNIAFWRDGKWVTPYHSCGGLDGVMKRWLIEKGYWTEGTVMKDDVRQGEWVLLSNGLKGCFPAQIA